jgi:diguanylate cyclase (GGDEF)-like protein
VPQDRSPVPRGSRDQIWNAATWLLLAVLAAASIGAGLRWRTDVRRERAAVFHTTASAVASSVATTLRRQTDLTTVEQALIGLHPDMTNHEFAQWFDELGAATRYPGSLGFGFVERVPADHLAAFAKTVSADPTKGLQVTGDYAVFPSGNRAEYCLLRLTVWLGPSGDLPPTLDYCAPTLPAFGTSPTAATFAAARDSGRLTLAAPVSLYPGEMFAFMPVYQGGVTPATVAERRDRLMGWVAGTFDGTAIISAAEGGHGELQVEVLGSVGGKQTVLVSDGRQPEGPVSSLTIPVDAEETWSVRVSGAPFSGGVSATGQGLVIVALGLAISLLLFGGIQVLLRSRSRALRLVHERTEQLRHRALHDDLTGLPNRALIMDRIEQMLHRARRQGTAAAVLFIDLDSFKDVNDTYGHAAGDALLRAVALRLSATLRGSDTAGRIGGDEFVVLVEGASLAGGPATVAQRLLDVLSEPFALDQVPGLLLDVRASVGVAVVESGTPDDVLREADIALYKAKAAGKSCFAVFSA